MLRVSDRLRWCFYDGTLVGSSEGSRSGEMAHVPYWDAAGGRDGGAQRTVWVMLLEMERFKYQVGEKDQGAVASSSLLVVWVWATHFSFPRKKLRMLCGYFGQ